MQACFVKKPLQKYLLDEITYYYLVFMKRTALALTIILALLFSLMIGTQFINLGRANPISEERWAESPIISIQSPVDDETFSSNDVPLNFTITKHEHWLIRGGKEEYKNMLSSVNITLDGKLYRQIEVVSNLSSPFSYSGILTNLPDGVHNLAIQTECEGWDLEIHGLWARKLMYENSSDLITFTVYEPEPFPVTVVVAATAISATVVGVGLMVYFKNRKR